ncbi:uncharacterized protein L3040_003399 [Drepanopeziza brunnea f. sp. 'multigermtubi']|uniref:ABC-type Fe3+ transport system n=1 Tax=Marssonina brunnea f. sp. multigermtubi (strain MB_m1) TaxID=1072389 RepID=K1WJ44_MARBU|nr:ABC-type Fe3+ transport system [Drepanopeziza brunnea f. sp. 'multigermtubi' MB_m1]EKD12197.1 ABC-type Fe3+ transport system [Drepanopeziza brunnea f. sp. 'multigermtubi' MB_m1]KAJ5047577.1 hypothetical protein L3040_003399 [Drepanopeziza brunnea f. sp. 'multigermtubi']
MSFAKALILATGLSSVALALPGVNPSVGVETRTLDELHQAALSEGGVVTLWHGGDEINQQDSLKAAFEARFPGMTLNLTVDLSKYLDGNLDQQIADNNIYVDSIILQTLHDYPRWKEQGVLMPYKPAGFDSVYANLKDPDATYVGLFILNWANCWNVKGLADAGITAPKEYTDYLKPEFKDRLVLIYPNDDDAVLYQFDLIIKQYGVAWFESLLAQNPKWVRGGATPFATLRQNGTEVATFTAVPRVGVDGVLNAQYPAEGQFVSWAQTGSILKNAPHPEGAKLLHNFMLSPEFLTARGGWSTREDMDAPAGYPKIMDHNATDPTAFTAFMSDRAAVERLRFFIESRIGIPQGPSPLVDGI